MDYGSYPEEKPPPVNGFNLGVGVSRVQGLLVKLLLRGVRSGVAV